VLNKAIDFFQWLLAHPLHIPMLAVLPDDADKDILRTVSEVADDFVLCPVRNEELHQRLIRILGEVESETDRAHDHLTEEYGLSQLIGADPAFLQSVKEVRVI